MSAGITGARLGLNSRGTTYVHGGRHGLYYRKNLKSSGARGRDRGAGSSGGRDAAAGGRDSDIGGGTRGRGAAGTASDGARVASATWNQRYDYSGTRGTGGKASSAQQPTDVFVDTGTTFPSSTRDFPNRSLPPSPPAGSVPVRRPLILSLLISAWLFFMNIWAFFISLAVPVVLALRARKVHQVHMNRVYAFTDILEAWINAGADRELEVLKVALEEFNASVPDSYKPMYHQRWYVILVERAMEECLYDAEGDGLYNPAQEGQQSFVGTDTSTHTATEHEEKASGTNLDGDQPGNTPSKRYDSAFEWSAYLQEIENVLVTDTQTCLRIRLALFQQELEAALEDHLLSSEEEYRMQLLTHALGLDGDNREHIKPELELMESASRIRNEIEKPLEAVDEPGLPLVRGEVAYRVAMPVRLLNERVLNRYQRHNVVYRELGYEIELEGKVVLTDRRMVFIETTGDTRTREYRLNKIADVIADPARNLIEIILTDRKSPVIITSPQSLLISAVIERIQSESE